MAKGNMFLGMARGKVGDVVFYRADGQQLSRVRNRNPRNPRSNAQLFQRAIMATIVQAYTAGKAIFDHSFEGYSVGAQNQREFIKRNAKKLREIIAADINTPIATNDQLGRVVAPGVSVPVPFSYEISAGSYEQNLFVLGSSGTVYSMKQPTQGETVAEYASRIGLVPGDIYTIVAFIPKTQEVYTSNVWDDVLASQRYCSFVFVRMIVKSDLSSTSALTTFGQIFDIETAGENVISPEGFAAKEVNIDIGADNILASLDGYIQGGSFGIIRSRRDADLRSNTSMVVQYGMDAETMFGIASDYLLDAWRAGTTPIGDSDLILEGGGV